MDTNAPERTLHAPHDAAAAHMISRRSAPCFRRGESAAFDRIRTAIVRHRRDTGRDLRPRSHCTPGLSCATDARVCIELGSRAKTGLGARRSPQKAVSHRRRTKRRLAIAQRSRSASAHLRRRAHERPQPGAAPGCNPPFVTLSLGLDPGGIARSTASACRCGSFDDDAAERRRIRPMPNLNARDAA
jgi:hypothetical protein